MKRLELASRVFSAMNHLAVAAAGIPDVALERLVFEQGEWAIGRCGVPVVWIAGDSFLGARVVYDG